MKSTYLFVAAAALLTASCADDSSLGGGNDLAQSKAIAFDMQTPAMLKANTQTGQTAATTLGNEFIVWGEKNEATDGTKASDENLVFKNYKVQYTDGSAYTTTSNTENWEYVGIAPYAEAQVSPAITAATQTIKYWDYNASNYTFTAVSADKEDIANGKVVIKKIDSGSSVYAKGYTIDIKDGATTGDIYVADRNYITKSDGKDRTADNAYGGNATFTFRNFQSKVRFAVYEVIPGYKVKVTSVKFNGTESTDKFGVDGQFIKAGNGTSYTVTYEDGTNGTTANKAKVAVSASPSTDSYLTGGAGVFGTDVYLGTASTAPTYDISGGGYTSILPNPSNATNMKLTISYDLISEDTGEKISLKENTAEVPAAYCQWQANYAYTYIFKITDNAADLYPITFDAQVITDENGTQETITSVSEPSITTFAVTGDETSGYTVVTGKDEYEDGNTIYASVVKDGTVVSTLTDAKVYTVTTDDADKFPITAASVANALDHTSVTGKVKATALSGTSTVESVPVGDGSKASRTLNAIKWTATANTTYAVEYSYTDNSTTKKVYKIVKVAAK
jgi:hypothetical protein